jgi:hypothetical protein
MSAPNGNVTAWIAIVASTIVTVVVSVVDPSFAPETVTAFFAFLGGLMMGRYIVPSQPPAQAPSTSPPG